MKKQEKPIVKYIDPLSDFGFKRLFSGEPNKDLLIDLLNGIFRGKKHIVDLVYNKNEHPGETIEEGGAIFDLTCTGDDGSQFVIEVQRGNRQNFMSRTVFYLSRLITEQAPKGKRQAWGYALKEVYIIALLEDFSVHESGPTDQFFYTYSMREERTHQRMFKAGHEAIFIELVKFVKTETELTTNLDKWLYVLKNMSRMDKIPVYLRKSVFEKLFNIAEYSNLSKREKVMYDSYLKRKWDNAAVLKKAVEDGKAKAEKELEKVKAEAEKVKAEAEKVKAEAEKKVKTEAEKAKKETEKAKKEAEKAKKETEKAKKETEKAKKEEYTRTAHIVRSLKKEGLSDAQIEKVVNWPIEKIKSL